MSKFSVSLTPISGHQDSAEVHDSSSQLVVVLNCFHGRFPPLPFYKVSERMSCEHVFANLADIPQIISILI